MDGEFVGKYLKKLCQFKIITSWKEQNDQGYNEDQEQEGNDYQCYQIVRFVTENINFGINSADKAELYIITPIEFKNICINYFLIVFLAEKSDI
jgi:hypothetical protein